MNRQEHMDSAKGQTSTSNTLSTLVDTRYLMLMLIDTGVPHTTQGVYKAMKLLNTELAK